MSELKPFDKFMDALVNCDTVKVILTGCGESVFETKPIYEGICALANRHAEPANAPLAQERFEQICEAVHNGWWEEKKRQGVTDHPDMIPYCDLSEPVKEYDRVTVRRVLDALQVGYYSANAPLTLDELRGMDGEPVYIVGRHYSGWTVPWRNAAKYIARCPDEANISYYPKDYGKTWLAYRHKPDKEG